MHAALQSITCATEQPEVTFAPTQNVTRLPNSPHVSGGGANYEMMLIQPIYMYFSPTVRNKRPSPPPQTLTHYQLPPSLKKIK